MDINFKIQLCASRPNRKTNQEGIKVSRKEFSPGYNKRMICTWKTIKLG